MAHVIFEPCIGIKDTMPEEWHDYVEANAGYHGRRP